jgi:3-isopropylmalate/(R)-2-methylmalate dehydratase small subunit
MEKFVALTAVACPLPLSGIDTDQIIPARFLNRTRAEGYGEYLFHDLRAQADFPLNQTAYLGAQMLVARRNFGGGSSREAAVYALLDYGIRCVIAPSFGDIFAANAVGNGLLPAVAAEQDVESMLRLLQQGSGLVSLDLAACRISLPGFGCVFSIDPVWQEKLLHGWDDVDLTLSRQAEIDAFVARDRVQRGWAWLGEKKQEAVLF